jgi:alkylation response protein AidB-like acyl-CoA dehydrogenase
MIIAEALGGALVVEPYVDTAVLGAGLLRRCGGPRADEVLARIVAGTALTAFAATEIGPDVVATTAHREGEGWVLDGAKSVVTTAPLATHLLVTARTTSTVAGSFTDQDGVSLFLLDFDAAAPPPGMTVHPLRTIDDRVAADVLLDGVRLPGDALVAGEGEAAGVVEAAVHEATAAVCSEAVGCMRTVLADTVEYCKQRTQFGQPISRFQVLQHRMVDMYLEVEQAAAATYLAMFSLEASGVERARAVSAAKVTIARAARFVGQNAVQLHGGMGMTEELAVGHYFKRLTAIEYEFGAASTHLARYAALTDPRAEPGTA